MICLSDNDLLKKLAFCDLLEEAIVVLETTYDEVFILPTARFSLLKPRRTEKTKAQLGEVVYQRLKEFIEMVNELQTSPSPEELLAMNDVLGIDPGEAILFSSSRTFDQFLLATRDKKSLRALNAAPQCEAIVKHLVGRAICFEQIILRIIEQVGFDQVRAKVVPALNCDEALRSAFGAGLNATHENVDLALRNYTENLRRDVGTLLVNN